MSDETTTQAKSADREPNEAKTPTVRGFFRRGAWKQRLDACGLPAETRALVASTVQATKLRPAEKLAVADELIAHFHDADHQGVEPAAARANFGEPAVAAKLIRRAKKRNRGVLFRVRTAARWCFLGFAVFYAVLALRFYTAEPEVKVDHLAEINAAAAAVPEGERAWPEIRDALLAMGFGEGEATPPDFVEPREAGWDALAGWLTEQEAAVDDLMDATERERLGYVSTYGYLPEDNRLFGGNPAYEHGPNPEETEFRTVDEAFVPHLGALREAARVLQASTWSDVQQGRGRSLAEGTASIFKLARYAEELPLIINARVGASQRALATDTLAVALGRWPDELSDDELRKLQGLFSTERTLLRAFVAAERALVEDLLQKTYTDDGSGGGRITAKGLERLGRFSNLQPGDARAIEESSIASWIARLLAPAALPLAPNRANVARVHDELMSAIEGSADQPLWKPADPDPAAIVAEYEADPLTAARYALVLQAVPAISELRYTTGRGNAELDAAVVALSLHRHRLATGNFPDPATGYAELVPSYLDEVPLDPLHGTPLRWTLRDGRPVVYSLGADGDDDGGVPPTDDLGGNRAAFAPPEEAVNGDWIAWPPQ